MNFPGFLGRIEGTLPLPYLGSEVLDWTPSHISWYRDLQLFTLIAGTVNNLAGYVIYDLQSNKEIGTQNCFLTLLTWLTIPGFSTAAPYTRFNTGYGVYPKQAYFI
jgi:hypothetical protein